MKTTLRVLAIIALVALLGFVAISALMVGRGTFSRQTVMENWKPVVGYEGLYEVSDLGRVKGVARVVEGPNGSRLLKKRILKQSKDRNDYLTLTLCRDGKSKTRKVHQLDLTDNVGWHRHALC